MNDMMKNESCGNEAEVEVVDTEDAVITDERDERIKSLEDECARAKDAVQAGEDALKLAADELEAVKAELSSTRNKIAEVKMGAVSLKNDFDNFRKRNAESVVKAREDATNTMLFEMVEILDNFERARPYITDENSRAGFEQIEKLFLSRLTKHGVAEIEALGKPFDMNTMNVIAKVDCPEESGTVVDVVAKGYTVDGKVLRHVVVRIAN